MPRRALIAGQSAQHLAFPTHQMALQPVFSWKLRALSRRPLPGRSTTMMVTVGISSKDAQEEANGVMGVIRALLSYISSLTEYC